MKNGLRWVPPAIHSRVEYAYPVFTGFGFSDPEARRGNDVHCNRLGAVAVLRTHGVRLVHDKIALRGSSLAQVNRRGFRFGITAVQRKRYS